MVDDATCVECGVAIRWMFADLVDTDACLCRRCADEVAPGKSEAALGNVRAGEVVDDDPTEVSRYEHALRRIGIPQLVQRVVGLTFDNQAPELPIVDGYTEARDAVRRMELSADRGILCLSGNNGVGKTVAGAWLSWVTRGRFLTRAQWCGIPSWDAQQTRLLVDTPGIVTLDEVCSSTKAGDPTEAIRLASMVACERHDRGKGTVLTTRADKRTFDGVFGNDMLDRMRAHESTGGSGWVVCKGRSMRGTFTG